MEVWVCQFAILSCTLHAISALLLHAQVLKKISDIFGYKSIEDFMTSHLDYLVMEWLKINDSGYSLSAFPYVLLNYTSLEEFYM